MNKIDERFCVIKYSYRGKVYEMVERPTAGWEVQYEQNVINRIESLVDAGAVIIGFDQHR